MSPGAAVLHTPGTSACISWCLSPKRLSFVPFLGQRHFHISSLNGEQQGVEPSDDPLYTQLCCSVNVLLCRMPRGRGRAHLLILCPQVPGAPADARCYLFQALATMKGMLGQGKGEDEAAWFGGSKFGRVLWAMKLELQT